MADATENRIDGNAETTETPSPEAPSRRTVTIGGQTIELDAEQAELVQRAADRLAGTFGQRLEEERRSAQEMIRAAIQRPEPQPQRPVATDVPLPDPDLMLPNPAQWQDGFARAIDARLARHRDEYTALVQAAAETIKEDFSRREADREFQRLHDSLRDGMYTKYAKDLDPAKHGAFVQAVYDESYNDVKDLPADQAIDRVGAIAVEKLRALRGEPEGGNAGRPASPALLSSRRGTGRSTPQAPERKTLSDRIMERQDRLLRAHKAA